MSRDTGYQRRYERDNFSRYDEAVADGRFAFPVGPLDDRLGAADIVVAVEIDGTVVAYPTGLLDQPFDDTIGDTRVVVTPFAVGAGVQAVSADGSTRPIGTRTGFWFSIASAFPDVEVRTP